MEYVVRTLIKGGWGTVKLTADLTAFTTSKCELKAGYNAIYQLLYDWKCFKITPLYPK